MPGYFHGAWSFLLGAWGYLLGFWSFLLGTPSFLLRASGFLVEMRGFLVDLPRFWLGAWGFLLETPTFWLGVWCKWLYLSDLRGLHRRGFRVGAACPGVVGALFLIGSMKLSWRPSRLLALAMA